MDREKVIKGLECCLGSNDCNIEPEEDCPYKGMCLCAMALRFDVLALLKEKEEKLKFLDALYNYINPNDMEKYMQMYKSLPIPSDGRSVK